MLSRFLGCWDEDFYGGDKVREFEEAWRDYFGVRHAISVNSNTSGLIAAVGAIGIEPGDQIIVSPWTMCATATSILVWNAIPVFADIEKETFNLDPESIRKCITPKTKAIIVTDIFGHAARLDEIMGIAREHGLKVIEDAAQAPGALYGERYVGTIADIGVFSLNYHKHIHTGEGGMCVTDNDDLAERLQLIRNHGEAVVEGKGVSDITNMIGFNFRLGEIEAAIGIEQLKKLDGQISIITDRAVKLTHGLAGLPGLQTPRVLDGCSHVFYVYPLIYDPEETAVPRARLLEALRAEGVRIGGGYQNIHLLPMYQKKTAYGNHGFPWSVFDPEGSVSYAKGICPVAEKLHDQTFLVLPMCLFDYSDEDIASITEAFQKVWRNMDSL
ncbi:MAG: DegT/DnrJ/EryC1/StrS family aminotransferase [Mariprofundaceae bacterium]|nr:DegT/DnrJ/EryC1/StrS family aminotransferase [Mariprofundaceae bacterium]